MGSILIVDDEEDILNTLRGSLEDDGFEVWTAGAEPRNVALASAGGQAAGQSRVADDFAAAYSAALTIDGKFGARWLASGFPAEGSGME